MRSHGNSIRGRIGEKIAGAAAAARGRADTTRAYITRKSPGTRSRLLAIALTVMLIGSIFAPIAATGLATAQQGPPGLEKAPADNLDAKQSAGPPSHAMDKIPTHAAAWDVHASAYATDLETTVDVRDTQLRLVFSDDRNHQGRQVAIAASALEDSLGERPSTAFGLHESGDRWTSEISYRNGYAIFEIPMFSSNTVTFEGEVSLTGSPATDGTSYTYELSDSEEASNFTVDLTGNTHRETRTDAQSALYNGDGFSIDVDGTTAAEGPASGSPELTMIGGAPDQQQVFDDSAGDIWSIDVSGTTLYTGNRNGLVRSYDLTTGSLNWEISQGSEVNAIAVDDSNIYVGDTDGRIAAYDLGTQTEQWSDTGLNGNIETITVDGSHVYVGRTTVDFRAYDTAGNLEWTNGNIDWNYGQDVDANHVVQTDGDNVMLLNKSDGTAEWTETSYTGTRSAATDGTTLLFGADHDSDDVSDRLVAMDKNQNVQWTVDFGTGIAFYDSIAVDSDRVYVGLDNGSVAIVDRSTREIVQTYDGHLNQVRSVKADADNFYTGSDDNQAHVVRHATRDASVSVDGSTVVSQTGRLEGGETVTGSVSLSTGSHSVDVSSDGPVDVRLDYTEVTETVDPSVEVNGDIYRHAGTLADGETTSLDVSTVSLTSGMNTVNISVSESYSGPIGQVGLDYSHTATDAQSVDYGGETFSERYNVSKTYASERTGETLSIPWSGNVVGVRNLEMRRDGGSWTTPSYSMTDGTLEVEIGSVSEGETVEIRTTGTKVDPRNGEITVTDATVLGDDLSSEIRIDDYSSGFEIGVSGTLSGNETHYTHSESWSNPQTYARVGSSGEQSILMPNAGSGSTARISTIPLEPQPQDGHIDIRVRSTGSEPEFEVLDSSSTSSADLTWHDTTSGATYQLYSLTTDAEVDRAEASSPVTLTHDGSAEILAIYQLGSGGSGGATAGPTGTASSQPLMLIALVIAGLLAIYIVSRRMGDESISGGMLLVAGSAIVALLAIQSMAPGILARSIGSGLESAMPILLLGSIGIIIVWLRSRGDDVTLNIRGR